MRKNFFKKLSFGMALALVLGTTAHAGVAQAAEAAGLTLKKDKATVYLNEDNVKGTPSTFDFDIKGLPEGWKDTYAFEWRSADPTIATVGKAGKGEGVSVGTTTITCYITEKDGGKFVDAVEGTVTVKANAAEVEITNKKDYDFEEGITVNTGDVIDLDRAMYDENGNKTTKRGVWVTDYTRWYALDENEEVVGEDVVSIDPATGKFTMHKAGGYVLVCETYQSSKNSDMTAQDCVGVIVQDVEPTYTVGQSEVNELLVLFDMPYDAKAEGFVEADLVSPIKDTLKIEVKVDEETTEEVLYKDAVAYYNEDKTLLLGVKVIMWESFANKGVYTITFNEDEAFELVASVGQPASVEVKVENPINKNLTDIVYVTSANQEANKITFAYKDALGIDVTNSTVVGTVYVSFECDEADENYFDLTTEDGVAYLTVYPGANGKKGQIVVKYTEYNEETGEEATIFTRKFAVTAKDAPAVKITKAEVGLVSGDSIPGYHADKVTLVNKIAANDSSAKFVVWAKDNWNKEFTNASEGFTYKLSNDKAAIEEDGTFVPYMTGTVRVSVYYADPAVDEAKATFVTSFNVTILEDRVADSMTVDKKSASTNLVANVVKKATELTDETKTNIVEEAKWEVKVYDNFNTQWKEDGLVSFKDDESKKYFDISYNDGVYTVTLKNNDTDVMNLLVNKDNAEKSSVTISGVLVLTKADGTTVEKTVSANLKKPATLKVSTYKLEVADANIGMADMAAAKTTVKLIGYNSDGVKVADLSKQIAYVPYGNQKNVKENLTAIGNSVFAANATGSTLVYTITTNNGKDIVNANDTVKVTTNAYDKITAVSGQVVDVIENTIYLSGSVDANVVTGSALVVKANTGDYTVTVYEINKDTEGKFTFTQKATDTFKVKDEPAKITVSVNSTKTEKSVDNTTNNAIEWTTRPDVKAAILDCFTIKVGNTDAKDYGMVFEVRSNGKTLYVKSVRVFAPALDVDGKDTSNQNVVLEASIGKVITLDAE